MTSAPWRWIRRGATVLALFAVVDYFVLPQVAGTREALRLTNTIEPGWVVLGVALEISSFVSYSLLTRSVLPDIRPSFSRLIRTDVTALGVSHVLPGGAATASALRYRLLTDSGVPSEDAAVGMAVEALGSTIVLVVMTWIALVASIPLHGGHSSYVAAAAVGAVLMAAAGWALFRHPQPGSSQRFMGPLVRRLPRHVQTKVQHTVDVAAAQIRQLLADKHTLRVSAAWAAGNWAMDAGSLWVFLAAYGHRVNIDGLFVAYGVANLAAILPVSPGGLGIIEGVLIPSLVGFGTPRATAILGVISWRLFDFWAPIPAAGVCFLSLRRGRSPLSLEPPAEAG